MRDVRDLRAHAPDGRARGPLRARGGRRARRRLPALPGDRARARLAQGGHADDADRRRRPAAPPPRPPELLGLRRATGDEAVTPPEPILRRLSDDEVALLEAADLFNGSTYRRTVGGIAKSLGDAQASIVPLSGDAGEIAVTVAWDLSWYQYRVSPDSAQPVRLERRGHELDELEETFKTWNAHVEDEGRLVPEIARL